MKNSKNKNRLEIRLDPDSQSLLDSLMVRTSLTKTSIIKNALKVYASALKGGHIYTVKLKGDAIKEAEKPPREKISQEEVNQFIEESKNLDEEESYDVTKYI